MTMTAEDRARWEAKIARQSSYVDFIMETAKTDPLEAAVMLLAGLMAGNREELRLGYSIGNALIATLEQLKSQAGVELTQGQIGALIEKVAVPKPGLVEYGPVMNERPIVLFTIEGGVGDYVVVGDANVIQIDYDETTEGTNREYIEERIEEIEALPDSVMPTIDKVGILATLREDLDKFEDEEDA